MLIGSFSATPSALETGCSEAKRASSAGTRGCLALLTRYDVNPVIANSGSGNSKLHDVNDAASLRRTPPAQHFPIRLSNGCLKAERVGPRKSKGSADHDLKQLAVMRCLKEKSISGRAPCHWH